MFLQLSFLGSATFLRSDACFRCYCQALSVVRQRNTMQRSRFRRVSAPPVRSEIRLIGNRMMRVLLGKMAVLLVVVHILGADTFFP